MNFLIIGFGSVGKRHAKNLTSMGINCIVVEPNIDRQNEALNFGFNVFSSIEKITSELEFIAILICSPPVFHVDQTKWALSLGKKVFLEKPISLGLKDALQLRRYDYKNIFIGYTYRWNPQFHALKKHLIENSMGKLYYASFTMGMNLEDWHPWEDYRNFFMSRIDLGGGVLLDESHFIELAIELFGLPSNVFGIQSKISNLQIETDDYVFSQFKYDGLIVDICLDIFRRPYESNIQIFGDNGSIMCDFIKKVNVLTNFDSLSESKPIFKNFDYERNDVFREMMLDFIDFVKSDSDSVLVPLSRGLEVMLLVEKIRQSSQRKKWTKVGKL